MKYLLAVSGGVDSVVMLDKMAKDKVHDELCVAHVSHGIRSDSEDDRRFVEGLAAKYGLEFVAISLKLGSDANEELARTKRYEFLFSEAKKRDAIIMTAHHADDLAATVAINLYRGTGWRGLAVLARAGIERPLLAMRKSEIYDYAIRNRLEYSEDSTNANLAILRNGLRGQVFALGDQTIAKIGKLRNEQVAIAWLIDQETTRLNNSFALRRYPYTVIEVPVAVELLRAQLAAKTGMRPTRVETERLLLEIKTARPGALVKLSGGVGLRFSRDRFIVEH